MLISLEISKCQYKLPVIVKERCVNLFDMRAKIYFLYFVKISKKIWGSNLSPLHDAILTLNMLIYSLLQTWPFQSHTMIPRNRVYKLNEIMALKTAISEICNLYTTTFINIFRKTTKQSLIKSNNELIFQHLLAGCTRIFIQIVNKLFFDPKIFENVVTKIYVLFVT